MTCLRHINVLLVNVFISKWIKNRSVILLIFSHLRKPLVIPFFFVTSISNQQNKRRVENKDEKRCDGMVIILISSLNSASDDDLEAQKRREYEEWFRLQEKEAMEYSACVKYQEKEKASESLVTQEKRTIESTHTETAQNSQLIHFDNGHNTDSGRSVILNNHPCRHFKHNKHHEMVK